MKQDLWHRFWSKVAVADSGCWEWTAAVLESGYGEINIDRYPARAHRVAFSMLKGEPGEALDHLCKNKVCVNPDHLEAVTIAENMRREADRRTSCKRGHQWPECGVYTNPKGDRMCRSCRTADRRAWHVANGRSKERIK